MSLDRVLFVGYLWPGSTSVPRLDGLHSLGLHVEVFDCQAWLGKGNRIAKAVAHRFFITPGIRAMNVALVAAAARTKPDVVWIEKGTWIYPSILKRLRDHARFLIHYNTDDVFYGRYFWLHRLGVNLYDLHLTTNRWNVLELRQRYGVRTFRVGMGYDQDLHRPPQLSFGNDSKTDVVFVGHWEPHTESYIAALRDSGVFVEVWGGYWRRAKDRSLRIVKVLEQEEYVKKIASAKMALCSLSRQNRNESTGRSFEIPAIGTFLLAERTLEHEYLFGDGSGAALFSSDMELVEKARHYLAQEEARRAIATQGHERCLGLGLSWGDHVRREWPLMCNLLCFGTVPADCDPDSPFWKGFRHGKAASSGGREKAVNKKTMAGGSI